MIVDTDGGVDDATALWWLLQEPTVRVLAITIVWGNVDVAVASASVCRVLHAAGRSDIPVALGSSGPFRAAPALKRATFIHGDDGLGNTNRMPAPFVHGDTSAVVLMRRLLLDGAGEVSLLTLGPLTNVAHLVTDHPEVVPSVGEIVIMGGVARGPGNALPLGEANIVHDPAGASVVIGTAWPRPGMLVGLDVTNRATLGPLEFELLAQHRSAAAAFLDEPIRFYRRFGSTFSPPGECPQHDLLAAMAWVDPSIVDAPLLPVTVDMGGGAAWGTTVVDLRQPLFAQVGDGAEQQGDPLATKWRVALGVDVFRFRDAVRALFGEESAAPTANFATD